MLQQLLFMKNRPVKMVFSFKVLEVGLRFSERFATNFESFGNHHSPWRIFLGAPQVQFWEQEGELNSVRLMRSNHWLVRPTRSRSSSNLRTSFVLLQNFEAEPLGTR